MTLACKRDKLLKILTLRHWKIIIVYAFICIILAGIGMGVPILNIMSGFFIGWFAVLRAERLYNELRYRMSRILLYSTICAVITMAVMLAIWGRTIPLVFGPVSELENFGHPMILFDPRLSFIGWLVLMIIISPFLQLMTSIFSAFLRLRPNKMGQL
jgi:hypothetical protein